MTFVPQRKGHDRRSAEKGQWSAVPRRNFVSESFCVSVYCLRLMRCGEWWTKSVAERNLLRFIWRLLGLQVADVVLGHVSLSGTVFVSVQVASMYLENK